MTTTFQRGFVPRALQMIERQTEGRIRKTHLQSFYIANRSFQKSHAFVLSHKTGQDPIWYKNTRVGQLQQCQCDARKWDRKLAGDEVGGRGEAGLFRDKMVAKDITSQGERGSESSPTLSLLQVRQSSKTFPTKCIPCHMPQRRTGGSLILGSIYPILNPCSQFLSFLKVSV